MSLSAEDRSLLAAMEQRAFHLKKRQRATDLIVHRMRRYRAGVVLLTAVLVAVTVTAVFLAAESTLADPTGWWLPTAVVVVVSALLGVETGAELLRSRWGRSLLARKEGRLRRAFSTELQAGRRWQPFQYQGEDVSAYVPQILHLLDTELHPGADDARPGGGPRFHSVAEALAFAKRHRGEGISAIERALARFDGVAAEATELVVSSTDGAGRLSSRVMRFVESDRPGVWYVTTAPESPKVREFDRGRVAVLTVPTGSGATISSNRVSIRRSGLAFRDVADLYRAQVPGFVDGMTDDEQERELVYELRLSSAKVESWLEQDVVDLDAAGLRDAAGSEDLGVRRLP